MSTNDVKLYLTVADSDADAEWIDDLTLRLMRDLRDLGAESVERPTGELMPEGSKAAAAFTLGALVLVAVPAFLPKLVEFVHAWVMREERTIKVKTPAGLEVEFTPEKRLSQDELLALVEKLIQVK